MVALIAEDIKMLAKILDLYIDIWQEFRNNPLDPVNWFLVMILYGPPVFIFFVLVIIAAVRLT